MSTARSTMYFTQCGNFRTFLFFRFYVKSSSKTANFVIFWGSEFCYLVNFSLQKVQKKSQKSKFRATKCAKMADFALLESPSLISRKIWVIEKSCFFHTVLQEVSEVEIERSFTFLHTTEEVFLLKLAKWKRAKVLSFVI